VRARHNHSKHVHACASASPITHKHVHTGAWPAQGTLLVHEQCVITHALQNSCNLQYNIRIMNFTYVCMCVIAGSVPTPGGVLVVEPKTSVSKLVGVVSKCRYRPRPLYPSIDICAFPWDELHPYPCRTLCTHVRHTHCMKKKIRLRFLCDHTVYNRSETLCICGSACI
jgi:hypothetical protein